MKKKQCNSLFIRDSYMSETGFFSNIMVITKRQVAIIFWENLFGFLVTTAVSIPVLKTCTVPVTQLNFKQ